MSAIYTPKMTTLATSGALTGSYVVQGSVMASQGRDQGLLLVNYTKGDETSLELEIQFSDTSAFTDAYQEVVGDTNTSTGVTTPRDRSYTFTASTKKVIPIQLHGLYWRVRAKATAGTPTGTLSLQTRMEARQHA